MIHLLPCGSLWFTCLCLIISGRRRGGRGADEGLKDAACSLVVPLNGAHTDVFACALVYFGLIARLDLVAAHSDCYDLDVMSRASHSGNSKPFALVS